VRIVPGLLISLAAVAAILLLADWRGVGNAFRKTNLLLIEIAFPFYILSYAARAMAWKKLLGEVPFRKVFLVMNAGYLINNVFPFRMGEFGRTVLLGRKFGFLRVFSTIMVERAIDLIFAAVLLLGTLPFALIGDTGKTRMTGLVAAGLVTGLLVVMAFIVRYPAVIRRFVNRLFGGKPRLVELFDKQFDAVLDGLATLRHPGKFAAVLGWMLVSWGLAVGVQYLFLKAIVPEARLVWAGFALGFSALGVAVPSSPAYVGVYEGAIIAALSFFSVDSSQALAYALIAHGMYIGVTGVFGAVCLMEEGQNLGNLYQQVMQLRKKTNH